MAIQNHACRLNFHLKRINKPCIPMKIIKGIASSNVSV